MKVNLIPNLSLDQTIHCSRNDTALRKWSFELFDGNIPFTPVGDCSLVFPDGEIQLEQSGDSLLCDCTAQLSAKSGMFPCKIKIENGSEVMYSSIITLHCEVRP